MRQINEYIISKSKKRYIIKATDETIQQIVKDELDRLGHDADLNHIDVSKVTNMSSLFACGLPDDLGEKYVDLNPDISKWNVSRVYTFDSMFSKCKNFNCDLSEWEFGKQHIIMHGMFFKCESFNQDISSWNVDSVSDMSHMFNGCKRFNKNISNWNIENVNDVYMMFSSGEDFSQDLSEWTFNKICVNKAGFRDMFYDFDKFPIKFMPHQLQKLLKQ